MRGPLRRRKVGVVQAELGVASDIRQRVSKVMGDAQHQVTPVPLRPLPQRHLALDAISHIVERVLELRELVLEPQIH